MHKIRNKFFAALALAMSAPVMLLANDTTGSSVDFSAATTTLTSIKTALVDWVDDALPLLTAIAGAFMLFWIGRLVFRVVKSWTNSAK